jgi:hypothetical protein
MEHIGSALVGVAFFAFLAASAVAGIVSDYKKRRLQLEPLRAAIERGQQLDPAVVERLMEWEPPKAQSQLKSIDFRIGGIVTVASGIGVGILAFFLYPVAPRAFYPVVGVGVVAICVGVGLLVCARVIEQHVRSQAAGEARS